MRARNGIAAVALLLVALVLALAHNRTSPGALTAVHAAANLATPGRCADCHPAAGKDMAAACVACHADIGAAITARRGLHGQIDAAQVRDCAHCHAEHQGPHFQLAGTLAFSRAGFATAADYRHQGLDFALSGAHATLRCEQCHKQALADPLPSDAHRFLGLSQACTACHEDPHKGKYGADCASCHGQSKDWKAMDGLDHDRFCPLVGSHQALDCKACHRDGTHFAVDALVERHGVDDASPDHRDCLACHVSPHRAAFVSGVVALLATATADALGPVTAGTSCNVCHSAAHATFAGNFPVKQDGWHAATGFPLDKPHDGLRCESCHPSLGHRAPMKSTFPDDGPRPTPDTSAFLKDFPGRQADDCQACHSDPHQGQFAAGAFKTSRCLDCHDRHAFAPASFDVAAHAQTEFPLEGAHARAQCADCHRLPAGAPDTPEGRATRRFADVPTACSACHASPHRESFLAGVAQRLSLPDGAASCSACHAAGDADFTVRHDDAMGKLHASAGFPLEAPHAKVACVDCHPGLQARRLAVAQVTPPARLAALTTASGAPPAAIANSAAFDRAFPGRAPDDCKACHADVHRGQFDRGPFAGQGCLTCHDRHAFTPVVFDEQLHARSRFALTGAHLAVGCNDCHLKAGQARGAPTSRVAAAKGDAPRVFAGTPGDCAACHADVHAGDFDGAGRPASVDGATGCARCHTTSAWDEVPTADFDHALWTGYALDGAHARAACIDCHAPSRGAAVGDRAFGKAAGTACSDCHADVHAGGFDGAGKPASVGGATSCARCHTTASFTDVPAARFDHAQWTGYALDGAHARAACAACHVPRSAPDGSGRLFGRAAGRACSDCHAPGSVRADGLGGGG